MLACFFLQRTCNCDNSITMLWINLKIIVITKNDQKLFFIILLKKFEM
jgi:hypothetical protein